MTSHAIEAYGGIQLDEAVVADIADAVATGEIPMHFQHNISRPLHVSNVIGGTERLEDGHLAAWAEFDVDEEVWMAYQEELAVSDAPGGMSISITTPLGGENFESSALTTIAADAHHFNDEEIRQAVEILGRLDTTASGERLYQFSFIPEAMVVFDLALAGVTSLGPNLAASAIYDAAKGFLVRRGGAGIVLDVRFRETRRGTKKLQLHLEVRTEEELRAALEDLPQVLAAGASGTFSSTEGDQLRPIKESTPDRE